MRRPFFAKATLGTLGRRAVLCESVKCGVRSVKYKSRGFSNFGTLLEDAFIVGV